MKKILLFYITYISIIQASFAQSCPNQIDISNTNVCGLYGDAQGNSNWNWELVDPLNPSYCNNWYARTGSNQFLTRLGSPFVNPGSGKLQIISDENDYKKEKGWELLMRNFGCFTDVANPYFLLYNKYSGMCRVYMYMNSQEFTQYVVTVKAVYDQRPATTSQGITYMLSPDKYLNNQAGSSSSEFLVSVNESVGANRWAVGEFFTTLDPNIQSSLYSNAGIEVTVYGVVTSTIQAFLTGSSCTSQTPGCAIAIPNYTYFGSNPSQNSNGNFNFTANGEKLKKLSTSINDVRKDVNESAKKVKDALANKTDSFWVNIRRIATEVESSSNTNTDFIKIIDALASITGLGGSVMKFIGTIQGLFSSSSNSPAASPTYSTYNLVLKGTLEAKTVVNKFVVRVPGIISPATNANNATYYNGNMGIFNFVVTPKLYKRTYDRRTLMPQSSNPGKVSKTINYTSYVVPFNYQFTFNKGVDLNIVSVQAALMAIVTDPSKGTLQTVLINPLESYPVRGLYTYFNHMFADIEANRLEITNYDPDYSFHTIQTPFDRIECFKGRSIHVQSNIKVFIRVRAILKRATDSKLIYFVRIRYLVLEDNKTV